MHGVDPAGHSTVASMKQVVLDASVGVKWFRDEPGSERARDLLKAHGAGEITIVVPSLFVYELMNVAARCLSPEDTLGFWERFVAWRIPVRGVGDDLVRGGMKARARLGCSLYDAVAPALAAEIGAPLYSADRAAHAGWPGVTFI
jgi:predicted nucleic acid-binding protein